jgi:hypothetical protein
MKNSIAGLLLDFALHQLQELLEKGRIFNLISLVFFALALNRYRIDSGCREGEAHQQL